MRRNLNQRPVQFNTKLIETITITILVIFSIWLLTACKKESVDPIQTQQQKTIEESKRKNDSILAVYDNMQSKTIISTPCNKNKGIIYGLQACRTQNGYYDTYSTTQSKADQQALNNDLDNHSMTITLYDSLVTYNQKTTRTLFARLTTYGYKYAYSSKDVNPTVATHLSWNTVNSITPLELLNNELVFRFSVANYGIKTSINQNSINCYMTNGGKTSTVTYCNLTYN